MACHGVPDEVVTDQGGQFTGGTWPQRMATLEVRLSSTTAYHPQANELVERMHRHLKFSRGQSVHAWVTIPGLTPIPSFCLVSGWRGDRVQIFSCGTSLWQGSPSLRAACSWCRARRPSGRWICATPQRQDESIGTVPFLAAWYPGASTPKRLSSIAN